VVQDLIENFGAYWEAAQANSLEQDRLLNLMLVWVWVEDDKVVQLCLRPNLHITAGLDTKRPTEISVDLDSYRSGSDGHRLLVGCALATGSFRLFLRISRPRMAA
jgi:hypothetical protein